MPPSSTRNYVQDKGYNAAAALTKFRAVKFSAVETVTPVTAITDVVAGVVQHDVTAAEILKGKGASIARIGATMMEASEAITVGQLVSVSANGRAAVASTGEVCIGICDEPATGAGEYCRVTLDLPGRLMP
jgi:uncharacterized protein DUF2190